MAKRTLARTDRRIERISVPVSLTEQAAIRAAAKGCDMETATWLRTIGMRSLMVDPRKDEMT